MKRDQEQAKRVCGPVADPEPEFTVVDPGLAALLPLPDPQTRPPLMLHKLQDRGVRSQASYDD